jgi:AcrR family transcriptional regulator
VRGVPTTTTPQSTRRDAIVRAALGLLEHHDYDEILVRDVARAAEVAVGTVSRHFTSKEHLFAAVLAEWSVAMARDLDARPLVGSSPPDRLPEMYHRAIDGYERRPGIYRAQLALLATRDPHAEEMSRRNLELARSGILEACAGLADDDALAVSAVMNAVLIDRAVDLLFSSPPRLR